jgi:hypothetical protein
MMMGASLPTFGWFDQFILQAEYFRNPFADNNYKQFQDALPQPAFPNDNPAENEYQRQVGSYAQDDTKWSIFIRKSLFSGLDLFALAANDHFRVQNVHAEPSYVPVTHKKSDWYYMLRFQWGM